MTEKPTYEELEKIANERINLKKQLKLLSLAVNQSSEGIAVIDLDGNLEYSNNAFAKMHGYSAEELVGKKISIFHTPEQMPHVEVANLEIKQTGSFKGEIWHVKRDGTVFPTIMHNSLILDEENKPIGIMGTLLDISDIKQTEEALQISERLLKAAQGLSKVGGWEFDLERQTMTWTEETYRIHGMTIGNPAPGSPEHIEKSSDCYPPEDRAIILEAFRHCCEHGIPYDMEVPFTSVKGRKMWIRTQASAVWEGKRIVKVIGNIMDITERKQVAISLQESQEKYRVLVENANEGIAVTQDGVIKFMNQKSSALLGFPRKELLLKPFIKLVHPDDQQMAMQHYVKRLKGEETPEVYKLRCIAKNGDIKWVENNGVVITWEDKPATLHLLTDITEQKQAEEEREQALSQLRTTLDATADGILVVDMKGKIVLFNKRFEKMWKLQTSILNSQDDDQVLALAIDQLKNPDAFLTKVKKLYADSVAKSFDTIDFKDGRIFERYSRPHLLNDEVIGRVWSFRDVTDRKLAEVALEKAKKQWETTFDAMSDWVCIINKDHEIIQSNKASESIINLSPDQVVGRRCYEIVHGMDVSILDCPLEKAIKSSRLESMEFKTAENRWLQIAVEPIKNSTKTDLFVHIVRDITELKEKENEISLLQKEKAFSILSGGIAHDYNNLLTIIWGNICILKEEMSHPSQQELFNDVEEACRQARDLTHQFITLSHVALLKKTSYNIEDILSSAIEKTDKAKDIEISMDIKGKISSIELDPDGLALAFENIICNAVEAMPDGGRLEILVKTETVKGQQDESVIKIFFKDSGIGISIHDIDSVFDPYFTTKELGIQKGGGLGLAVSQSIVRKHGGNVRINSKL